MQSRAGDFVSIVSTPHAGRLEGASDRPVSEVIRPETAPVATHCKSSTCRSVTWKNLLETMVRFQGTPANLARLAGLPFELRRVGFQQGLVGELGDET